MPSSNLVFLVGTGRCGSTLLAQMLCEHASVGYISGMAARYRLPTGFGPLIARVYQGSPNAFAKLSRKLELNPSEAYGMLAREVSPAFVMTARDLAARDASPWIAGRTSAFFERHAQAQHRPIFAHKITGWPRARFLHRVFPQARFVHLVRDGRAVASSLVQQGWWSGFEGPEGWGWGPLPSAYEHEWLRSDRSFAVLAGIEWMMLMDAFQIAREEVADDLWLDVRYEDLLSDPRLVMQQILGFLGLSWTDQFEAKFIEHRFRADRHDAYRRELDPMDVEQLDEVLAEHLSRIGYPVAS